MEIKIICAIRIKLSIFCHGQWFILFHGKGSERIEKKKIKIQFLSKRRRNEENNVQILVFNFNHLITFTW